MYLYMYVCIMFYGKPKNKKANKTKPSESRNKTSQSY